MAKPPNQDLINRLMAEMEEQKQILARAKDARKVMRELNRMIAVLGGEEQEIPRLTVKPARPVIEPVDGQYACPECGSEYKAPQGLAGHRRRQHGVAGAYGKGR